MSKENLKPFHVSVQTQFHRRGNPFKRWTWYVGVVAGIAAIVWVTWATVSGHSEIYEGGPVSDAHRMIEKDCRACHSEWSVLHRLVKLDEGVSSVNEVGCLHCHQDDAHPHATAGRQVLVAASEDQLRSYSPENEQSCGVCHREHRGKASLLDVPDQFCIDCHREIRSVDDGHPDFALTRLLDSKAEPSADSLAQLGIGPDHGVLAVLEKDSVNGGTNRWTGRGQIRFNHDLHLAEKGIMGPFGEVRILTKQCSVCHEPDEQGAYMQPVNYERHCAECHPLVFDPDRVRLAGDGVVEGDVFRILEQQLVNESGGENLPLQRLSERPRDFRPLVVPHASMTIVRGFLTDFYRIQATRRGLDGEGKEDDRVDPADQPQVLRTPDADEIRKNVESRATLLSSSPNQAFDGPQFQYLVADSNTGCFYCHTRADQPGTEPAGLPVKRLSDIPARWLIHSRFSHKPHRSTDCRVCHNLDPSGSPGTELLRLGSETSDVLMPDLKLCRQCHSNERIDERETADFARVKAGATCVQCHGYHQQHGFAHPKSLVESPGSSTSSRARR